MDDQLPSGLMNEIQVWKIMMHCLSRFSLGVCDWFVQGFDEHEFSACFAYTVQFSKTIRVDPDSL